MKEYRPRCPFLFILWEEGWSWGGGGSIPYLGEGRGGPSFLTSFFWLDLPGGLLHHGIGTPPPPPHCHGQTDRKTENITSSRIIEYITSSELSINFTAALWQTTFPTPQTLSLPPFLAEEIWSRGGGGSSSKSIAIPRKLWSQWPFSFFFHQGVWRSDAKGGWTGRGRGSEVFVWT